MALAPLATITDLEARGVTVEASETTAVNTFLDTASAVIRNAAGSPISQTTSTVTLSGGHSHYLTLPGKPVTAVTSVSVDGEPVTDFKLSGGDLWRSCGWSAHEPTAVTVTYTHGMATVPADLVDLTCRLAARQLVGLRSGAEDALAERMAIQERIGDWSAMYSNTEAEFTSLTLPKYEATKLAARFGNSAGMVTLR